MIWTGPLGGETTNSLLQSYLIMHSLSWCSMQNIPGIFQKLLNKSAAAHEQNIYAAVCSVFVPFPYGVFWVMQVRPLSRSHFPCVSITLYLMKSLKSILSGG